MEIKIAILSMGMALLICYLVLLNRREKSVVNQQSPQTPSQSPNSDNSALSIKFPTKSNREEFDTFLEKRKLEIFREILRLDHIAKQKRLINKSTYLREILAKLLGAPGAVEIFNYCGSVELFSDIYINYLGHIPGGTISNILTTINYGKQK